MVLPIHTGKLFGWPTQIISLIAALVAFSLPITGLFIYLNGRKKRKAGKTTNPLQVVNMQEESAVV
jgi:uncharacterized iron-regulated membrane protein